MVFTQVPVLGKIRPACQAARRVPVVDPEAAFHGSCVAGPHETTKLRQGVLNVKTFLSRATVVAVALAICLVTLQARAQTRPSGTSVAVIDLGEVFKAHPRLKTQLEGIKTQIDAYEAFVRQEQTKVQAMAEELKTLKAGTPSYGEKEKAFASVQAGLQVQVRQKSREFLEQEAQIRYQAYQEIQQHVEKFCQAYGIQLVIRFNRNKIDPSKPQEVQMGLNRPIVYQSSLDVTNHIITSLGGQVTDPSVDTATGSQIPRNPVR